MNCLQPSLLLQQVDGSQQFVVPRLPETAHERLFQELVDVQAEGLARGFCLKNRPKIGFSPPPSL